MLELILALVLSLLVTIGKVRELVEIYASQFTEVAR
jgi:hypothetical protein